MKYWAIVLELLVLSFAIIVETIIFCTSTYSNHFYIMKYIFFSIAMFCNGNVIFVNTDHHHTKSKIEKMSPLNICSSEMESSFHDIVSSFWWHELGQFSKIGKKWVICKKKNKFHSVSILVRHIMFIQLDTCLAFVIFCEIFLTLLLHLNTICRVQW